MADLKRSARAAVLLVITAASAFGSTGESPTPAAQVPCPSASPELDCQSPHDTPAAKPPATSPETPAGAPASPAQGTGETPPAATREETFVPSVPEANRPPLTPLAPLTPNPADTAFKTLERNGPVAPLPAQPARDDSAKPPGPSPAQPGKRSLERRAEDARLHQNLTWDYCGPKPGAARHSPKVDLSAGNQVPVDITADWVDYDRNRDLINLRGNIDVQQNDRRIEADQSTYDRRTGALKTSGQVFLEIPGIRLTGDSADYNLETKEGTVDQAGYRMSGKANLRGGRRPRLAARRAAQPLSGHPLHDLPARQLRLVHRGARARARPGYRGRHRPPRADTGRQDTGAL